MRAGAAPFLFPLPFPFSSTSHLDRGPRPTYFRTCVNDRHTEADCGKGQGTQEEAGVRERQSCLAVRPLQAVRCAFRNGDKRDQFRSRGPQVPSRPRGACLSTQACLVNSIVPARRQRTKKQVGGGLAACRRSGSATVHRALHSCSLGLRSPSALCVLVFLRPISAHLACALMLLHYSPLPCFALLLFRLRSRNHHYVRVTCCSMLQLTAVRAAAGLPAAAPVI